MGSYVNICGIPHTITECKDHFDVDTHFGQIDFKSCEIKINADLSGIQRDETIAHEMVHGILVHLGYNDLNNDETFVQSLANALVQGFAVKEIITEDEPTNGNVGNNLGDKEITQAIERGLGEVR